MQRIAFLTIALLATTFANAGSRCEISGRAELWSYDSCLWQFETDDTLHPGVAKCVDRNLKLIAKHGSCTAKRIFKDRICTLNQQDQDRTTCMRQDKPLGPSVKDGGI